MKLEERMTSTQWEKLHGNSKTQSVTINWKMWDIRFVEMKIEYINYPVVYTSAGHRIEIKDILGTPRVGSELVEENGKYLVQAATSDSECVNGVCPVR